jgi:hypothetical protein
MEKFDAPEQELLPMRHGSGAMQRRGGMKKGERGFALFSLRVSQILQSDVFGLVRR